MSDQTSASRGVSAIVWRNRQQFAAGGSIRSDRRQCVQVLVMEAETTVMRRPPKQSGTQRGFTLVELVVVIIIMAVLGAVAVPRFINLATSARVASVTAMSGAIRSAANNVYAMCLMISDPTSYQVAIFIPNRVVVHYCWPDAGDTLGGDQIDTFLAYTGFTATLVDSSHTRFSLDGAPDPANCSVTYEDAGYRGQTLGMGLVQLTTGC